MVRTGLAMAALLAGMPAWAAAPDEGKASDRALAPFVACRQQPDPRARVACYDAALDRLQQAVADRQVVIVDHEQAAQDRRAMFGFGPERAQPMPKPAKLARAPKVATPDDVIEVDSTVVSAQQYGYDQWTIRIATGAVWRTTEAGIPIAPRPGTKIHIHRALMNSYMLRVGPGRAVRAMRVG